MIAEYGTITATCDNLWSRRPGEEPWGCIHIDSMRFPLKELTKARRKFSADIKKAGWKKHKNGRMLCPTCAERGYGKEPMD